MDVYEVTVRTDKIIQVEAIKEHTDKYKDVEIYQEDLTADIAQYFFCEVESFGMHGNVKTRVVCDARISERKHKDGKATGNGIAKKSGRATHASKRK